MKEKQGGSRANIKWHQTAPSKKKANFWVIIQLVSIRSGDVNKRRSASCQKNKK
jgi:hypothetical protein